MEPFLGQTLCVAFNFAPKGWALCNGQLLPINQNQALFSLLGTTYGGNGQTNFALPNLQGRVGISTGASYTLGEVGGEEHHTLNMGEMPAHNHPPFGATQSSATQAAMTGSVLADTGNRNIYTSGKSPAVQMNQGVITNAGGSQAHENRQPYTVMNWIIALQGIFPSQN